MQETEERKVEKERRGREEGTQVKELKKERRNNSGNNTRERKRGKEGGNK